MHTLGAPAMVATTQCYSGQAAMDARAALKHSLATQNRLVSSRICQNFKAAEKGSLIALQVNVQRV